MTYREIFSNLSKSKFRSSFHLRKYMIDYIDQKGFEEIKNHATNFIEKRLAPSFIYNDGKQTPMSKHPVFIAQHATATCCRNCLYKWYKIPKDRNLTNKEIQTIVNIIMLWIKKEYDLFKKSY